MPSVKSDEANQLAERLALENELRRADEAVPLWERLKPLRDRIAAYSDTGLAADKAFFDDLSGDG